VPRTREDPPMPAPHPGLAWAEGTEAGRAWLARLPQLLEDCREQWSLVLEPPFPYACASYAAPARGPDATDAVLKICFPHRESEHEAEALRIWNGSGAVRLIARDAKRWALLLERCRPGTALREAGTEAALDVLVRLLPRLWVTAGSPFRTLAQEAAWWADSLTQRWEEAGRPFERGPSRRGPRCARGAGSQPGRAGALASGPTRKQRPSRRAGTLARDRSEAARRRAGVLACANRPLV
jgi:Aminoglycoside/hydroxyurea antibiotic resistance kinase